MKFRRTDLVRRDALALRKYIQKDLTALEVAELAVLDAFLDSILPAPPELTDEVKAAVKAINELRKPKGNL